MILKKNVKVSFFFKKYHQTARTRLCNLAGTEWELPEDDVLALQRVWAINKEQYNKTVNEVCICLFITHMVEGCAAQRLK